MLDVIMLQQVMDGVIAHPAFAIRGTSLGLDIPSWPAWAAELLRQTLLDDTRASMHDSGTPLTVTSWCGH